MMNAPSRLLQALDTTARPKRPHPLYAVSTFTWRSVRRTLLQIPYVAIDVAVFPIVFLLIFTYLFGGAIAGSTGNYLQFLLPGMLVYTVTSMTVYIGITIKTDMDRGVFNRFRTLPFWQPAAIIGSMLVNIATFAAALLTTLAVGIALGFRPEAGIVGVILAFLLVVSYAFSISWIFACIGIVVRKMESISSLSYIVMYPLLFTSNVFADTSTMPEWLGRIVAYNPVSLASSAARGLMHGTASLDDVGLTLAGLAFILAVFMPLAFRLYRRKAAG